MKENMTSGFLGALLALGFLTAIGFSSTSEPVVLEMEPSSATSVDFPVEYVPLQRPDGTQLNVESAVVDPDYLVSQVNSQIDSRREIRGVVVLRIALTPQPRYRASYQPVIGDVPQDIQEIINRINSDSYGNVESFIARCLNKRIAVQHNSHNNNQQFIVPQ